jgi:hypothetical protein
MPSPGQIAAASKFTTPTTYAGMVGVGGLTSSDYYATSVPGGDGSGGSAGYFEAQLFRVPGLPASATRALGGRDNNSASGHGFATTGQVASLLWGNFTVAGTRVNAPTYAGLPSNLNKMVLALGCFKDGSYSRLWVGGARVGTQTVTAAVMNPGSHATVIGKRIADGLPATGIEVFGLLQGTGEPTDAEVLAWYNACVAANQLVALTGATAVTNYIADVKTAYTGGGTAPATLGSGTMAKNGSPTLILEPSPSWV